jgi:hypothetical protein
MGERWKIGWHHLSLASHPHPDLTVSTVKNWAKTAQKVSEALKTTRIPHHFSGFFTVFGCVFSRVSV